LVSLTLCYGPRGRLALTVTHDPKENSSIPEETEHSSVATLREKLIMIWAWIVPHCCYITFQITEVAIPRDLFADILRRIDRLRPQPCLA
jgi:hypothetical protein